MTKKSKILNIIICLFVILSSITMFACTKDTQNEVVDKKPVVAAIVDAGGLGDYSFNDTVLTALEEVQKEEEIDIRLYEAKTAYEYTSLIKEVINEEPILVLAVGSSMKEAVENVAKQYENINFAIIDATVDLSNVQSINFADNESAFLAGYVAAKTTKTNNIAFIAGEERDTTNLFYYGYLSGAKVANDKINVEKEYVGTFYDESKAKSIALDYYKNKNIDVIMHVAGSSGKGVIEAAKESEKWVIGADRDQSQLASQYVLCSTIKNITSAMQELIEDAINEKFEKKSIFLNMDDEGVDLSDSAGNINKKLQQDIENIKKAIVSGKIKIPTNNEECESFEMPENILKD